MKIHLSIILTILTATTYVYGKPELEVQYKYPTEHLAITISGKNKIKQELKKSLENQLKNNTKIKLVTPPYHLSYWKLDIIVMSKNGMYIASSNVAAKPHHLNHSIHLRLGHHLHYNISLDQISQRITKQLKEIIKHPGHP